MAKLYPPSIEGVIPAFHEEGLVIPFVMNKTVSKNQVKGFAIKIKSIHNNSIVYQLDTTNYKDITPEEALIRHCNFDKQELYFSPTGLQVGVSYKVQVAYVGIDDQVGYFSTVGVVKYTAKPEVTIDGLQDSQLHSDTHTYIGRYNQQNKDVTEKVYSYNFTIYNDKNAFLL